MHLFAHNFPLSKLTGENVVADPDGNQKPVFDLRFRFQTNEIVPPNMICRENKKVRPEKCQTALHKSNLTITDLR
ncbi:MAG TPA: hypothetical protein VNX46_01755 [Candidatus Acidoferrum sp.]|jgi:hypothetical protein|nr:hypothetical protein [Candidatus Acidoferrum sp.]